MWDILLGLLNSFADRAVVFAGLFGSVSGYLAWRRTDTPKNDTDRNAVIASLREDRFGVWYKAVLTRALDMLDAKLSVDERNLDAAPRALAIAWSYQLLSLSLSLAIAYPMLSLFMNWGLFSDGSFGGYEMIPDADLLPRVAALAGLVLVLGVRFFAIKAEARAKFLLLAASFLTAVTFLIMIIYFFRSIVVPIVFIVSYTFLFGGVFSQKRSAPLLVLVAFGISFAGGFAPNPSPTSSDFAIVAFVALASSIVAVLAAEAVDWIGTRTQLRAATLAIWSLLGIVAVSLVARHGGDVPYYKGLVLFIGALPLLNGLADFASTGLTRYLLRRSLHTSGRWEAALDLIGGVAIYLALGCAIIAFIAWTPLPDQTYLANLPRIFQDLGDPVLRGQYWWLLAMLALTLLPTALHLHLFLMTLIRHRPARLRHWLANEFEQAAKIDSNVRGRDAVYMLSALNAFAAVASLWLMVELWLTAAPIFIDASITIFRAFALAIGALP